MCFAQEYSATLQADVICRGCWYPSKGTASVVNQGGTADQGIIFVPDRACVLSGEIFFFSGRNAGGVFLRWNP